MKIIVASSNEGKIKEIKEILKGVEILTLKDAGYTKEIEETGSTFFENALIKAKTIFDEFGIPALADDSGLCVDALDGAPGIYSARYSGLGVQANMDKLLDELKGVTNRKARFVSTVVLYTKDKTYSATGETAGEILTERQGNNGFGYDPIFYSYDLKKSFGECSDEEKNAVSHRARAISGLYDSIKDLL